MKHLSVLAVVLAMSVAGALEVGVASVDITPDTARFRVPMGGYGARMGRPATGAHDPLKAKVLYFRDGGTRMALITCDLRSSTPEFKGLIAELCAELGLSAANIMIAASHTHDGPSMYPEKFWQMQFGKYDPAMLREMAEKTASAVREAAANAAPARVGEGSCPAEGMTRNRRWGYDQAAREAAGETPLTNPVLRVLRVDGMDGACRALLVNFASHPTILSDKNMLLSAEWPGVLQRELEAAFPGAVALYTNGAQGDQSPAGAEGADDFARIEDYGRKLAKLAAASADGIETVPDVAIACGHATPELPAPVFASASEEKYAAYRAAALEALPRHAEIQLLAIGGTAWVGLPGEPVMAVGMEVRRRVREAGFNDCVPVGLANDYIGYILNAAEYAHGGYEVDSRSFYGPGLGDFIAGAAERLAGEVNSSPSNK